MAHRQPADDIPGDGLYRLRPQPRGLPLSGASGAAAQPRLPRLRGHDRLGHHPPRGRGDVAPLSQEEPREVDRHVRWRTRRGLRSPVGHADPRGRNRFEPRRHARASGQRAEGRPTVRGDGRLDGRGAAGAGPAIPLQADEQGRPRRGEYAPLPRRHQHAPQPARPDAFAQRDRPLHRHADKPHRPRHLPPQPHDRRLHHDRPALERHGRGGHDHRPRGRRRQKRPLG